MWQPTTVERALFKWQKWRNSIIKNWVECQNKLNGPSSPLELVVGQRLEELGLPDLFILKLYWICCVSSDYNLDYPTTFGKIVMPADLQIQDYEIKPGTRVYPPAVIDEEDVKFEVRQFGFKIETLKDIYSASFSWKMLLQSGHELLNVLSRMRGRPERHGKRGRLPYYSDRLTVQCAALKDYSGMSYVKIAERLHLPVTKPFESWQSDVAVHLVDRGRKLLREVSY